jgi:predicted transcriptional regulator YheO
LTDHEIVQSYIPMAKFITAVCGQSCEVVLHDLEDVSHSIVFIANGELTGRKVGDGLINFTVSDAFDYENTREDFVVNLTSEVATARGDRIRCSSYYIRNKRGKIIGFLGVNQNLTELQDLRSRLNLILNLAPGTGAPELSPDKAISAKSMVDTYIDDALDSVGCSDVSLLTKEDRRHIIDILEKKNIFIIKGCVNIVAKRLQISAPSIYRYIGETRGVE